MALKPIKRKYNFSDGTLAELGDALIAFAERDLVEMTIYGYDQPRIDLIKAKVLAFKNFMPDEYYTGLLMEATAQKNTAIFEMTQVAEGIVQRAYIKWDRDSYQAKAFGYTGYTGKTDADKMVVSRLVHKTGTDKLPDLAAQGLTALILGDLATKTTAADLAITKKAQKVSERDAAVNERITLGNDLYAELVKLADTGKHIWEDTNEAKYNDYVIYAGQPDTETVSGSVAAGAIHQPSVTIDNVADEITVEITSGELTIYVSDDPTNDPQPGQTTFTVTPASPFNGTAAQLNWTVTDFRLLLKNDGASDVAFSVTVRS